MCGISGYVSLINRKNNLLNSLESIKHRGPDFSNSINFNNKNFFVGIAHARLSIIDLSIKSNQPFVSSCGNVILSYNGEIYNYLNLRKLLVSKGIKFLTNSDTEVIIEYYKYFGTKGFIDLDGIFSFSLIDKKLNQMFLVRDHIGIKPLYYYFNKKTKDICYSSEIRGIKKYDFVNFSICKNDIYEFFNCGWLYEPNTGFKYIKKIEPGCFIKINLTSLNLDHKRYFDNLKFSLKSRKNLNDLIIENINSQLISDVPLGLFFSGGIDSTLIAAYSKKNLNSISVLYSKKDLKDSGTIDDYPYQKKISKILNFNFSKNYFEKENLNRSKIIDLFKKVVNGNEELNCDLTYLPSSMISNIASKNKFKVMLSGMGGDEMFGGYPRYLLCRYYYFFLIIYLFIKPFNFLIKLKPSLSKKIERFNNFFEEKSFVIKYTRLIGYFSSKELDLMFNDKNLKKLFKNKLKKILFPVKKLSLFKKALYLDTKGFLSHNLIVADKSSMINGIELRVPLISRDIISKIFTLNDLNFINYGKLKIILKKMLEFKLPKFLIYRKKTGFNPPLDNKINLLGKDFILDIFKKNRIYRYVSENEIKKIVKFHFNKKTNNTYKISQLLFFSFWITENLKK